MYEVDDSRLKDHSFIDSESRHYEPFYDFIRSLGFDVAEMSKGLPTNMVIEGEQFDVNFDKAPYLAKNGWTRDVKPRKDRCIEITTGRYPAQIVAKVRFNVEIDKNKLVNSIQKAIDEKKARKQADIDREQNKTDMLEALRKHYYASAVIASMVKSITVKQGILSFWMENIGWVNTSSDGKFTSFNPKGKENMSVDQIKGWVEEAKSHQDAVLKVCAEVERLGSISAEFDAFAKEAYHGTVRRNEVDKY